MKKKVIKAFLFAVAIGSLYGEYALAQENIYEKATPQIKMEKSFTKDEFKKDAEGLKTSIQLINKTDDNYEVGISMDNGDFQFKKSFDTYAESLKTVEAMGETEGIPVILDDTGKIVYATRSMGRIIKMKDGKPLVINGNEVQEVANIYADEGMKNAHTYINTGYIDDVPVSVQREDRAKILISGYEGWIDSDTRDGALDIVPLNQAINPSYYIVKSGTLHHFISSDLMTKGKGYTLPVGSAPSFMKENQKYYSYDMNYFYTSLEALIDDFSAGTNSKAVNKSSKYYNYYNNLPLRSKTLVSPSQINSYITKNTTSTSKLRNTGSSFVSAQNAYGVNALLMLGVAANESGWGNSSIAQNNNNIFGLGAFDEDPGNTAHKFSSISACINDFAKGWMSKGYLNPNDWRFYGAVLGNKAYGINVKYASDPYWSEKASGKAYSVDKISGLKDLNNYQLGVYNHITGVYNSKGTELYKMNEVGTPVILANNLSVTVAGKKMYKTNIERPVSTSATYSGDYNWGIKGYVPTGAIKAINKKTTSTDMSKNGWKKYNDKLYFYEEGFKSIGWDKIKGKWYYFGNDGAMYEAGWHQISGKWYYLNENGDMETGWKEIKDKWYYFGQSGQMRLGWNKINNKWYHFRESGVMQLGWKKIDGKWYYLNTTGDMEVGWKKISNKWYYFGSSGVMRTDWQKIKGKWYHFRASGAMELGWGKIDNQWYHFGTEGNMHRGWKKIKNKWYYFGNDGAMYSNGTYKIGEKKYHFNKNGEMA